MEESLTECSLEKKNQDNNNKIIVIACIILVLCFVAGLVLGLGYNVDVPLTGIKNIVEGQCNDYIKQWCECLPIKLNNQTIKFIPN